MGNRAQAVLCGGATLHCDQQTLQVELIGGLVVDLQDQTRREDLVLIPLQSDVSA